MKVEINKIKTNPNNPRLIKDYKFKQLVMSIKEFPEMLEKRPIVVDENFVVLGGNMRLKACQEAGLKEIYVNIAKGWTEKQKQQFIIKDNIGYGEWDWDVLANEWNIDELNDWHLDLPPIFNDEEPYTKKIDSPKYEASEEKPNINELVDDTKTKDLIRKIQQSDLNKKEKDFLIKAAQRHIVFNYAKIADYYANSEKDVQQLMEDSALIIIDFKKAIEQGYVNLNEKITDQYIKEYGE